MAEKRSFESEVKELEKIILSLKCLNLEVCIIMLK